MTRKSFLAFFMAVALGGIALGLSCRRGCDHRHGYNLVPVVVAAVDLPAGTMVTFDMISQRSVPEQYVTSSVVKPDSASYVVNQVIEHSLQAGDPLRWDDFPVTVARALTPETRAVRVEVGDGVIKGNHVDLWLHGTAVARDAVVLGDLGRTRWVKVTEGEAEMIARSTGVPTVIVRAP